MKHLILIIAITINLATASSIPADFSIFFNIDDSVHILKANVIEGLDSNLSLPKSVHDTISDDITKQTYKMKNWGTSKPEAIKFIKGIQKYLIEKIDILTPQKKSEIMNWNKDYEKFKTNGNISIVLPSFYTSNLHQYFLENHSLTDDGLRTTQYSKSIKELLVEYRIAVNEYKKNQKINSESQQLKKMKIKIIELKLKIEQFRQHASQKGVYIIVHK